MPDYLAEADWKTVLNKPKNAGLRVQKTGISEKLRLYEAANKKFEKDRDADNAQDALKAVQALKKLADTQSKEHKAFAEATTYLKQVITEAGKREVELLKDIGTLGSVDIIKDALAKAKELLKAVKTADGYKDMDTKSLMQRIRAIGASCAKVAPLTKFGTQSGALTSNEALSAVTDENLKTKKAAVAKFLVDVESAVNDL